MRSAPPRLLITAMVGAALVVLALAGATDLVLRSDWLLDEIDADPETLFVAFTGPHASLLPGRIRFATLTLRSRDPNVEWEARLEDVTLQVALVRLAGRRLHVSSMRASAITFRLREQRPRSGRAS